ncbi:DUF3472 domain-containing protein [bacterium]|nr:DUF3472 domain-containing protein [bacterium]
MNPENDHGCAAAQPYQNSVGRTCRSAQDLHKCRELCQWLDLPGRGLSASFSEPKRKENHFGTLRLLSLFVATFVTGSLTISAAEPVKYRAARSVHWGWAAPDAMLFYNEMIVDQSTPGSYFMACGWNTGYFGIQELGNGHKVAIFSVWDPSKGDDPTAVMPEQRVELLHEGEGVRIKRFGGEGTGGQCMMDFDWAIGQTNKFLVRAVQADGKTAYEAHLWLPAEHKWKHLVTFRTRTGDKPFNGFYSFIEDFRRDYKSVNDTRTARFGNAWVKSARGDWVSLRRARFTASNAEWESKDNINGELADGWFRLQTGGDINQTIPLRSWVESVPVELPPEVPRSKDH